MKERIKSSAFWVSLISAVFLILGAFGVEIGDQTASSVINGVCSVLIMLGIVTPTGYGSADLTDCMDADGEDNKDSEE